MVKRWKGHGGAINCCTFNVSFFYIEQLKFYTIESIDITNYNVKLMLRLKQGENVFD